MNGLRLSKKLSFFCITALTMAIGWWLVSCSSAPQPYGPGPGPGPIGPSVQPGDGTGGNTGSGITDPRKRTNCREQNGDPCEGDEVCEDLCDDIFSKSKSKDKCKKLSANLVNDFYNIFDILDEGEDFDSINHESLDCLLDISETEFAKEVGSLNSGDTKSFLEVLAGDEDLSRVLTSEDKDFKVLEKVLDNLSSADERLEAFKTGVDGSDTFIDLIVENENEEAWDWIVEYISEQCGTSTYCNTHDNAGNSSDARELVFFCKAYQTQSAQNVKALVESDFFNDRYSSFIESLTQCGDSGSLVKCDPEKHYHFLTNTTGDVAVCDYVPPTAIRAP